MRPYEMMIILAPEIPEEELDPTIDTIESYITRVGGSVVVVNQESPWGRRRLAYPIRYQGRDVRDGFYTLWYFDTDPASIVEIEREIRLNDRIIRHLIIALDEQVTLLPQAAEGGEGEAGTPAATATAPEGAETPAADAAPATPEPAEAAPAEAEAAAADTSVATAAVPESAEEAAPAETADEATKE